MIISYLHEIRSDAEEIMAKSSWYNKSPRRFLRGLVRLHSHARGSSQCREYGRDDRRYDLQRPFQRLLLSHNTNVFSYVPDWG